MSFAVLYARGIWCFYQRDEQKFGVFENRVLRKICESGGGGSGNYLKKIA